MEARPSCEETNRDVQVDNTSSVTCVQWCVITAGGGGVPPLPRSALKEERRQVSIWSLLFSDSWSVPWMCDPVPSKVAFHRFCCSDQAEESNAASLRPNT